MLEPIGPLRKESAKARSLMTLRARLAPVSPAPSSSRASANGPSASELLTRVRVDGSHWTGARKQGRTRRRGGNVQNDYYHRDRREKQDQASHPSSPLPAPYHGPGPVNGWRFLLTPSGRPRVRHSDQVDDCRHDDSIASSGEFDEPGSPTQPPPANRPPNETITPPSTRPAGSPSADRSGLGRRARD